MNEENENQINKRNSEKNEEIKENIPHKTLELKSGKYSRKKGLAQQKRQLEYFKKRRKLSHIKIFISRMRVFLRLFSIMLLGLCFLWLTRHSGWYLPKNTFETYPNSSLHFEGNVITPNTCLLQSVRKVKIPNKPLYRIDTVQFEKEIKKISSIKHVYVKRFAFPASLKIVIEEKTPVISIAPNEAVPALAVFADDGTLIGREFLSACYKLPTYKVLTYEDYFQWNKKQVEYLQFLAKTAEMYSDEKVEYIDLRNPDDVRIKLQTVAIRLGQLNRNVFKRLKKISAILPQTMNLNSEIDYVDLRWEDSAYIKLKNKNGKAGNLPTLEEPNN